MAGADDDLDRAAILARRRRFIALAISGLASGACKGEGGTARPQPCLDLPVDTTPEDGGPIVEDPGAPVDGGGGGEDHDSNGGEGDDGGTSPEQLPQVCLRFATPQPREAPKQEPVPKDPAPQVCLEFAEPDRSRS